eukprot:m.290725 g.290725  ORF g.290725 m.290725 type:complete len:658 (+) comp15817_c0_seq4:212-2185(+)
MLGSGRRVFCVAEQCLARSSTVCRAGVVQGAQRLVRWSSNVADSTSSRPAVGIDLGTTQSCVAVLDGKESKVLLDHAGQASTPSVVAVQEDGSVLVGYAALNQAALNTQGTFAAVKRLMGRKFTDREVEEVQRHSNFSVREAPNGEAWIENPYTKSLMSPAEVGSHVLKWMKKIAENRLGSEVQDVVVTVPAYFNDNQRQATKNAGTMAGLNVLRILNEPTAAALAYGYRDSEAKVPATLAIYDLGGGTFDISILHVDEFGVFEVLATNGDTFLGGEDVDAVLTQKLLEGLVVSDSGKARVKQAAEKAKIALDNEDSYNVVVPFLKDNFSLRAEITRSEFEEMCQPIIERTVGPCKRCLRDAKLRPQDIDSVLLVGGMSSMPLVAKTVEKTFKQAPSRAVDPIRAVAAGAAVQAGILTGKLQDLVLVDVTPLSLGIETFGGLFNKLIPRNTVIPTQVKEAYTTGVDNQTEVVFNVLQGERPLAADNESLGTFVLSGLPRLPSGKAKIAVTFDINADGMVTVSAHEESSNAVNEMKVSVTGGMTQEEIQRVVEEANMNKQRDVMRTQRAELLAHAGVAAKDAKLNLEKFKQHLEPSETEPLLAEVESILSEMKDEESNAQELRQRAGTLSVRVLQLFQKVAAKAAQSKESTDATDDTK